MESQRRDIARSRVLSRVCINASVFVCLRPGPHYPSVNVSECFIASVPPIPKGKNRGRPRCRVCHFPRLLRSLYFTSCIRSSFRQSSPLGSPLCVSSEKRYFWHLLHTRLASSIDMYLFVMASQHQTSGFGTYPVIHFSHLTNQ